MTYQGLTAVQLGHIAAEEEAKELQKYFIETEQYSEVLSDSRKIMVIGRKGSGKSAIYVALRDYLPQRNRDVIVEALSLQDYPWEVHKRIKDAGVPAELSYVNSWKYIMWVLLAKKAISYSQVSRWKLYDSKWWRRRFDSNYRYLHGFLKQNYGSVSPSFVELLADRARRVRSIQLKDFSIDMEAPGDDSYERLSRSINTVNREIQSRILEILSHNKQYYLLFDQLDLGWDGSEETQRLLIGLILAARDVVRATDNKAKDVRVVVFLRSDIHETLRFEDKNKIEPDVVELRWDAQNLQQLVSKRVDASANGAWEDVFTGDRMRQQLSQLSYIVKRTMLRPRDIIQFCVYAKDNALALGKERIDKDSIYEAERHYSDYMRKEFQDECKASLPEIDNMFELIKEIGLDRIERNKFLEACGAHGITDGESALRQLIGLSILGVHKSGGRSGGSRIQFRYQTSTWDRLEPTARLTVHPSLKHALGLVEHREKRR